MTYFSSKQEKHKHRYFVDSETRESVCLCGKLEGKRAAPPTNKFNAKKTSYGGYTYDSKKEGEYAAELDLLLRAGKIKRWERQYPIHVEPEGIHLFTTKVDFRVTNLDGSYELHEIKGWITARQADYRLKRKCIELYWLPKHPDHTFHQIN